MGRRYGGYGRMAPMPETDDGDGGGDDYTPDDNEDDGGLTLWDVIVFGLKILFVVFILALAYHPLIWIAGVIYAWASYKDYKYEKAAMVDGIRMPQPGEKWNSKTGGIPVYVVKAPVDPDDLVVAKNLKDSTRTWTMTVGLWHCSYELDI